jgi:predicted dehydrogenase
MGFVRWTEQRNFEAVLDMMADGRLDVKPLISHRFLIDEAEKAYDLVGGAEPSLGIILTYPGIEISPRSRTVSLNSSHESRLSQDSVNVSVSFIGSGNYASAVLIPAFKQAGVHLRCVASNTGVSGAHVGRKHNFDETTTDTNRIFADGSTQAVVITTQHDSHALFVLQALRGSKHIFVEKPLCLTLPELSEIKKAYVEASKDSSRSTIVMVGFNRRFAPQVQRVKQLLKGVTGPKSFIMTVNAGTIPSDHWTQDMEAGGGRIIGEACHFIDLLRFLAGAPLTSWLRLSMDSSTQDTVSLQLGFGDGSIGTVHYFANGSKTFPKERLEVFAAGRVLQLDNYRKLTGYGWPGFRKMNLWRQDKGQKACAKAFIQAIEGRAPVPIPFDEILEVSRVSIELAGGGV